MAYSDDPTAARIALGLLATLLIGTFAAINYHSHLRLIEIQNSGVETWGRISATQCANHGQMTYTFAVAGRSFAGVDACLNSCSHDQVGTPVKVLYARDNPVNSACVSLDSTANRIVTHYVGLMLVSIVLGIVIFKVTAVEHSHGDSRGDSS